MATDNCFRVTLNYSIFGSTMQNVIHFSGPSSDPAQREALAQAVIDNWIENVRFRQTRNVRYNLVQVRLLESQFDTHNRTVAIDGLATDNTADPLVTAVILRLKTSLIGRQNRGRLYIGGHESPVTSNGNIEPTVLNNWNIRLATIMGVFGPNGTSQFRIGLAPKQNSAANFKALTNIEVAPTIGVQRRRNKGVGI